MQTINLTFHGLGEIDRDLDPGEADVWVSRERYLSLLDAVQDRGDVRITFDDGNISDLEIGLPELQARGLNATFFVVAGRLGTPGFLDADGVRELQAAGMTIGCHGMRHRPWRRLAGHDLHEELVEAKRKLEDVVERPVTEAACPFGSYDRRVLRSLRRAGYRHVFTSDRGLARPHDWIQSRNSVHAVDDDSLLDAILAAQAAQPALSRSARQWVKRWR